MKELQFLSVNKANYSQFECNTISSPSALDSFKINVIDITGNDFYNCDNSNYLGVDRIELKQDLVNLNDMIANSGKSIQIVMLPKNLFVYYNFNYGSYNNSIELKNNLHFLASFLHQYLFAPAKLELGFEPNKTIVGNNTLIDSDFYFKGNDLFSITKAESTNKITTIKVNNNVYLTFLQLDNEKKIYDFLLSIGIVNKPCNYPEWVLKYSFNDDKELNNNINKCYIQIKSLESIIETNKKQIQKNLYYKSMLIETGDKLVEIVFNTLQELLDVDLSHFVDEKKEDVLFKHDNITFIGEIKGINGGVGNSHISQVDNHKSLYEDKLQENNAQQETIKKLLIINDQRNKPLEEREPIHPNQIAKANKEDVLIIRTSDLLNILEKYRQSKLSRDEIFEMLKNQTSQIKY